jgi:hypothetical protein
MGVKIRQKSKPLLLSEEFLLCYIIEDDNYHSLYTLSVTHKKRMDVIYIACRMIQEAKVGNIITTM